MTTTTAIDRGLGAELAADLAATAFTLAKRFAAGATMWSIAPSWEPHALHIAVEFVHPVIMGKRALPAVALTGPDLVDLVRVSVRPGDIVVAVVRRGRPAGAFGDAPQPGLGRHHDLDRQRRTAHRGGGRSRAVARRPRPAGTRDGWLRAVLSPVVGADPRVFRALRIAQTRMRRRGLRHLQRRGPAGRGGDGLGRRDWPRCAPRVASRTW